MIPVTKPFLPPMEEYAAYLQGIWQRNWLTNNGPLVNELEAKLKDYLDVNHLLYLSNGTIALQIAIKALGLKGEVITTPFSYVATTSSLVWEGCTPVFVDIDRNTLNIDPDKIEAAITPRTTGIIATHVYGNPCAIEAIDFIAKKHKLKVIYDAAHAFGVQYKGKSIYTYGDVSTASFHATKLFHTIEGGAVFTKDTDLLKRMAYMRNFGHDGPEKFNGVGINGKNSEFHAAMGLVNLTHIGDLIENRKKLTEFYDKKLINFNARKPLLIADTFYNYAYYPLQIASEQLLLKVVKSLNEKEVYPRRYFFPALHNLSYINKNKALPNVGHAASCALCLPLFHDLSKDDVDMICNTILLNEN